MVNSLVGNRRGREVLMGGRLFQSDVYCRASHETAPRVLILNETYKESSHSTSMSVMPAKFCLRNRMKLIYCLDEMLWAQCTETTDEKLISNFVRRTWKKTVWPLTSWWTNFQLILRRKIRKLDFFHQAKVGNKCHIRVSIVTHLSAPQYPETSFIAWMENCVVRWIKSN
jgi:hypothetical protein